MNLKAILAAAAVAVAAASSPAAAQTTAGQQLVSLGYCQLASIDASTLVSSCAGGIPAGAKYAYFVPEAQAIRYRDDGTAPTATVGQPVAVGVSVLFGGNLSALRVISQTAGAKLNVLFYR